MSWAKLLADRTVTTTPTSKEELANLRSIVTRSLRDLAVAGLSADNTFMALEAADPTFAKLSAYFDTCRVKRNVSEYDFAGGITDTDADGLAKAARDFSAEVEAWLKQRHPGLA